MPAPRSGVVCYINAMRLRINQHREEGENNSPMRYVVDCRLELSNQEQQWRQWFGAPPLTDPPLTDPPLKPRLLNEPEPVALLTVEQLQKLCTYPGLKYETTDVRKTLAFVEDLKTACRELQRYWQLVDQFDTNYTDALE